jgi:methylthioribose-1-phosphate isomerase
MAYKTLEWKNNTLVLIDQRVLPFQIQTITCSDPLEVAEAIRNMTVRGAPAIGAAAAYGLALAATRSRAATPVKMLAAIRNAGEALKAARPTAVNLAWAVDRVIATLETREFASIIQVREAALAEADTIAAEDVRVNKQIGLNALPLLPDDVTFLHHCNTGALATVDYGTALGVIRTAHEHGKKVFVYVDETRPRLQGARLTSWELQQLGIPHKVIVDGASGTVMKNQGVNAVTVGCDRVAANGDTANKIGTYNLAIVARAHGVPFYVVGPTSTIDLDTPSGDKITIEERDSSEISLVGAERVTPVGAQVFNPAFDVTPAEYITAIITEAGVCYPPYTETLRTAVERARQK